VKIQIVAMGTKMPAWVKQGYDEYAKRLPRDLCGIVELPLATRSKNNSVDNIKIQEGENILAAIAVKQHVVALDVKGKSLSTEALANKLSGWQMDGQNITILIGGPEGLSQACLERANERWSLSAMTLPHPLVRIVLIEQLYRAWTILQNHPYHK